MEMTKTNRANAIKMASDSIAELTNSKEKLTSALKLWLSRITQKRSNRLASIIREINSFAPVLIERNNRWKVLNQSIESVRNFAQARVDLKERIKLNMAKDAAAWAEREIENCDDLSEFLPDLVSVDMISDLGLGIKAFKQLRTLIVERIEHQNINDWTSEDLIEFLAEHNEIKVSMIDYIYKALMKLYTIESLVQMVHFDSHDETRETYSSDKVYKKVEESIEEETILQKSVKHAVTTSKMWGEFTPLVGALSRMDFSDREIILQEMHDERHVICDAGKDGIEKQRLLEVTIKTSHKENAHKQKELEQALAKIVSQNGQIDKLKERLKKNTPPEPELRTDASSMEENLKLARKMIEQVKAEYDKKADQLDRVESLLKSVLSSGDDADTKTPVHLTTDEIRSKQGVIIGGHYGLISKLRKELPNCVFYSPDAKTVDETVVKKSEYVFFFTGYVNHLLTGHALRFVRLYDIPCGYSDKTNIPLVLEDIATVFAT